MSEDYENEKIITDKIMAVIKKKYQLDLTKDDDLREIIESALVNDTQKLNEFLKIKSKSIYLINPNGDTNGLDMIARTYLESINYNYFHEGPVIKFVEYLKENIFIELDKCPDCGHVPFQRGSDEKLNQNNGKENTYSRLTTDRNDPDLHVVEETGKNKKYLVLSEEERDKGFVRPYRNSYIHRGCGVVTVMGRELSETYAADPYFYNRTYCAGCRKHFPVYEFNWDKTGEIVGS